MSTDISRGPRLCPSCGRENPPTAGRCWLCFTPLAGAFQEAPRPVRPDAERPAPLRHRMGLPLYTGIVLVVVCVLLALVTFGFGLLLLLPLAPAGYRYLVHNSPYN